MVSSSRGGVGQIPRLGWPVLAKVAVPPQDRCEAAPARAGYGAMALAVRRMSCAPGICFSEVSCDAGPDEASVEEQHAIASVAFVTRGGFGYRCSAGSAVLGPGAVLLGNAGGAYTCT